MPQERLPMRKIREVLRLSADGLSKRKIAASLGLSPTAAGDCIRRARRAGIAWPLAPELTDATLEQLLYRSDTPVETRRPVPEWATIHRELKRPGVTLLLLWEEHRAACPDGYSYSRWCEIYNDWKGRLTPTMRQTHVAGERLMVDYAGTTLSVIDGLTGEVLTAQLFVAVLPSSNYTYADATFTQTLPDWIGSHTRALYFFGDSTSIIVSDNLKSGITKACFYEPNVNRTYEEMAAHYGTAIVPARPKRPRDKAKVEGAVLLATRWIIAKLRNRQFFSLSDLNVAIRECVTILNERRSRHLGTSRKELFEGVERYALKPLPNEPYVFAEWKKCKVGIDYHVDVDKHYYSVPHQLLRETVWARVTARTVELFVRDLRVAAHVRASSDRKHTTIRQHMPSSHQRHADWTPERLKRQAGEIGPHAAALVEVIMRDRPHPEQGFRAGLGIIRLVKSYGRERVDAACKRALEIGARSYTSVTSILKNNLDRKRSDTPADGPAIVHDNIRGPTYFH